MIASEDDSPVYVLDSHTLFWHWTQPDRLGAHANEVFQSLQERRALALVPTIVVAELHYLTAKLRRVLSVEEILGLVDRAPSFRLEGITRRHLLAFGRLDGIPEMHDRLIGAVALLHNAPVISRDAALRDHPLIHVVW